MFFGLDAEKLILIGVIAALIMGPQRLPQAAAWLSRAIKQVRVWTQGAKGRLKEEMGDDFDDVEWRKLDPRQYDPRRIIRDALLDDPAPRVQAPPVAPIAPHVQTDAVSAPSRVIGDPIGVPDPVRASAPRPSFGAPKLRSLDDEQGFPPLPDDAMPDSVVPDASASAESRVAAVAPTAAQAPPETAAVSDETPGQA